MRVIKAFLSSARKHNRQLLAVLTLVFALGAVSQAQAPPCTLNTASPSVTICTPADGTTVGSPVTVSAGATDNSSAVSFLQIYIDGVKQFQANGSQFTTSLAIATGAHRLTVQAKDAAGTVFKTTINITVSTGTPPPPPPGLSSVKHIIFMLQENRSFDSYFGKLGAYRASLGLPGTFDGLPATAAGITKSGQTVPAFHQQTTCTENLTPGWNESHFDLNAGKMNRFPYTNSGSIPSTIDPQGTRSMGFYDEFDLPFYYDLASQFATSDRFFSSVLAPTIPNRMYMFTGTSFGHIRPDTKPASGWPQPTIFDALNNAGITWRYYFQDNSVFLADFATWNNTTNQGRVRKISSYFTDIQSPSTLPSVIFIERGGVTGLDEHPTSRVDHGAATVKTIIDGLLQSPTWANSIFILSFDEGGGLYDHVVPPAVTKPDNIAPMLKAGDIAGDFTQMGFRVPLIVLAPWVKPHFVSHTPMEFTSILKLIEKRFGVPALTARDAAAPDMTEFFDFTQTPLLTPPVTKFQPDVVGNCNKNLEKAPSF